MFQWQITLSANQVLMLAAFHTAWDDEHGSRFHTVSAMIADAWDVRAARKLAESGLISIKEKQLPNGFKTNIWNITPKGDLIALAIMEDADGLKQISLRTGQEQRWLVNKDGDKLRQARKKAKAK